MNLKGYYFTITLVTVAGLLLSIAFFPSKSDTPLMFFYDKQYEKAYGEYKKLYDNGDRSTNVVIPLAKILLEYAREEEAVALLEEYVDNHPQSIDALELLGEFYLNTHRSYAYLQNLERIYRMKPSAELLRKKERFYSYVGDTEGEIQSLEEIVKKYKPEEEEYLELAYRYASEGKTEKALKTLKKLIVQHPLKKNNSIVANFTVDLFAALGKTEEAMQMALSYQKSHPEQEPTLGLVSSLWKHKLYKQARSLLDNLSKEFQNTPAIIISRTGLFLEEGNIFLAYEFLRRHYASKTLPKIALKDFLVLAIKYNDMPILQHIIEGDAMQELSDPILIKILYTAMISQRTDIIETLASVLNEEYQKEHFPVAIALMLTDPLLSDQEKSFLFQFYETSSLSTPEELLLAKICTSLHYQASARKLLTSISSFEKVPIDQIDLFASLLRENNLTEKGWKMIRESLSRHPKNKDYERVWALLGSAMGETDTILQWFQNQEQPDEQLLRDVFDLAYSNNHASLSMHLAQSIFQIWPTTRSKMLLGKAWLLNGYTEKAYNLFSKLLSENEEVTDLYAQTLILMASKDPQYNDKLQSFVSRVLEDEKVSKTTLRDLGYLLIEKELQDQAELIFTHLAQKKTYDDPDQQTLLGLWSAQLGASEVAWVTERAKNSTGKEKGKWLRYLLNMEHYDELLPLVEREEWEEETILDVYVRALLMSKNKDALEEVIAYVIPQEGRLPRLKQYAKIARDEGLNAIATTFYLQILEKEPKDKETLLGLAGIYYFDGEYCLAKQYLRDYFAEDERSYLADYYYGEILLHEKDKKRARAFFQEGLRKVKEGESPNSYTRSIEAHFLYRLGYRKSSLALYASLAEENPDNLFTRVDYANILLDMEKYKQARKVLFSAEATSKDVKAEIALALAKARYFKENFRYKKALRLSNQLIERYPNSTTVLTSRADLEFTLGRWRRAVDYMDAAIVQDPKNERYWRTRNEILLDHLPIFALGTEYRKTGEMQKEYFDRCRSSLCLGEGNLLTLKAEKNFLRLGNLIETNSYDRYKGEIALAHACCNGDAYIGALYLGSKVFGAGVQTDFRDYRGKTSLLLEYHRPNWDFTETTINYGNRDMLGISRIQHLAKRLDASIGVSYNRYNLHGFTNATTTYAVEGQITYTLWPANCPIEPFGEDLLVNLNYSLDAEHYTTIRTRRDPFGFKVRPLAISNREFHTVTLYVGKRLLPYLAFDAYGGYIYDNIVKGKCVPVYGSNIIFGRKECLEGRLTYSHSTSTETTGQDVDRFIIDITYRWGSTAR